MKTSIPLVQRIYPTLAAALVLALVALALCAPLAGAVGGDSDSDGDGIRNRVDNCPLIANPGQRDLDSDGVGNACDSDRDGDGQLTASDPCPSDATNSCVAPPPPPPTSEACTTFSSPITITSGGTYSGCWQSTSFNTPAVTVSTTQPVVIQNSGIKATGYKIKERVENTNVTVRGTTFTGMNPNISGQSTEYALWLTNPQNVVFENNHLEKTPGIHIHHMIAPKSGGVTVRYNTASNIDARRSNGVGGYSGGHQLRQFFQTDHVQGVPVEVAWNQIINEPGQSAVEDNINLYLSRGTSANPINIHDNYVDGAFPAGVSAGSTINSYTGGGILCGDGGDASSSAAEVAAYIRCHHNQVLDTLNYGIALPIGHDVEMDHNRVVGDNDGIMMNAWAGVGHYCQNMTGAPSSAWFNNRTHDNVAAWMGNGARNGYWLDGDCVESNNTSLPTIDEAAEWSLWQSKLQSAGIKLGP